MTNIILCEGNATRLWLTSHTLMPKQFVKLLNLADYETVILEVVYDKVK